MRSPASSDMSGLAALAQNADPGLRPLILRVQAQSFADAPSRDRGSVASFEALALGLIPLVTSDDVADLVTILRRAPDTPPRVLAMLRERLTLTDLPADDDRGSATSPAAERCPGDLALARDREVVLDGYVLDRLVAAGRGCRELAQALLDRPEPTAFDRASLYRQADRAQRAAIRETLAAGPVRSRMPPVTLDETLPRHLVAWAERQDCEALAGLLGQSLGTPGVPDPDFGGEAESELLVLALVAVGLRQDDAFRILLTADDRLSHSVNTIFRLTEMIRLTSRPVAFEIVACVADVPCHPRIAGARSGQEDGWATDRPRREAGLRPGVGSLGAAAMAGPARRPGASARPDRRSTATTGRDRT